LPVVALTDFGRSETSTPPWGAPSASEVAHAVSCSVSLKTSSAMRVFCTQVRSHSRAYPLRGGAVGSTVTIAWPKPCFIAGDRSILVSTSSSGTLLTATTRSDTSLPGGSVRFQSSSHFSRNCRYFSQSSGWTA
jgi:hypothetical protein